MLLLQPDTSYHIYNHANGGDDLFREEENYYYFLRKWKRYVQPIADTYAYCLMSNHFHTLVRFKDRELLVALMLKRGKLKIDVLNPEGLDDKFLKNSDIGDIREFLINSDVNIRGLDDVISAFLSQQFSNLFNGYTKAINKRYRRYGSLFNPRFKRKIIDSESYFFNVLRYIHLNPVLHGFADDVEDWTHSSWKEYFAQESWVRCGVVKDRFSSMEEFVHFHKYSPNKDKLAGELE